MKKWMGIPLTLMLLADFHASAWANSELHPGGRLFFPLWDVSTSNRLTFIIVTRQALRDDQNIHKVSSTDPRWVVQGVGKCLPRGAGGSTSNVNRIDLGGTSSNPVFVDDVHFEYYGASCSRADEIVHMSCADTDLLLLGNSTSVAPRRAFALVASDGRGALDVHFVRNGEFDPKQRKLENSLMGHAVITDVAEGWVANYDAAAAKAVPCSNCANIDGGTAVGYENYPMEVYLPFALADGSPLSGGTLQNSLALWGPALLPAGNLIGTSIIVEIKWWDGRERPFAASIIEHSINKTLSTLSSTQFNVANFVCGHTATFNIAENDGFPRTGTDATACGAPDVADPAHKSDNFESSGDTNVLGHSIQSSTPIGWWRFMLLRDNQPPLPLTGPNFVHSGRGLVGVVLSSPVAAKDITASGPASATRLWHEDPCEVAQSGQTIGPPHKGYKNLTNNDIALFNTFTLTRQRIKCGLPRFNPNLLDIIEPPG